MPRSPVSVKPALSVILFTVLSGAGLGALALIALADLACAHALAQARVAAAMTTARRSRWCSSSPVSAHRRCISPIRATHGARSRAGARRGCRARRSRRSRSSRLPSPTSACISSVSPASTQRIRRWRSVLLAWAMLYCTAMIYASLKPIRQWHTARVPLAFWLLGHASGALLVVVRIIASSERWQPDGSPRRWCCSCLRCW